MASPLINEKEPRRYREETTIIEKRSSRRHDPPNAPPPPIILPNDIEYGRSRAPSRAPSRRGPESPVVILPPRAPSRAPSRYEHDPPLSLHALDINGSRRGRGNSIADDEIVVEEEHSRSPPRRRRERAVADDEIVVEEEHSLSPPPGRNGRYRRERPDDVDPGEFGHIGKAPPVYVKGEIYPSRLGAEGYDDEKGGHGRRY
jgi:hypothetical protein